MILVISKPAERLRVWKMYLVSLTYFEKNIAKTAQPNRLLRRVYIAAEKKKWMKFSCGTDTEYTAAATSPILQCMHANQWVHKAEDLPATLWIYYFVIVHFSHKTVNQLFAK